MCARPARCGLRPASGDSRLVSCLSSPSGPLPSSPAGLFPEQKLVPNGDELDIPHKGAVRPPQAGYLQGQFETLPDGQDSSCHSQAGDTARHGMEKQQDEGNLGGFSQHCWPQSQRQTQAVGPVKAEGSGKPAPQGERGPMPRRRYR